MAQYDFQFLSPLDFEDLSRDLLQRELGVTFESFSSGKDKGMDFRYSRDPLKKTVVQCKRYATWSSLFSALRKEAEKALKLKPKRYILTTSLGLTESKKEKIRKLFQPLIRQSSDIMGAEDLNNLLGKYPEIVKNHTKLWLASAHVLEKLLHSRINNQLLFENEKIERTLQIYVPNLSFGRAVKILRSRRFVIVSGTPGIGKSTLARMLVANCIALDYEELVAVSASINDAYDLYDENKRQVFFFDDFLGRVFLSRQMSTNEDQRLIAFIEKVSRSNNKFFILTTREYILAQAKEQFDLLQRRIPNASKCILELDDYSRMDRARILYNHIFFSNLGLPYIKNLLKNQLYLDVIDHPNYSPRIIDEITSIDEISSNVKPSRFGKTLIEYLDDQGLIWERAFESHISAFSKCLLLNMVTTGSAILYKDLQQLMETFAAAHSAKYGIAFSQFDFDRSIRELQNSFIRIDRRVFMPVVSFYDPSVEDFLIRYLRDHPDVIADILEAAPYFNQFFMLFRLDGSKFKSLQARTPGKIVLHRMYKELALKRIFEEYSTLGMSVIDSRTGARLRESRYTRLIWIARQIGGIRDPRLNDFLRKESEPLQDPRRPDGYHELREYIDLAVLIGKTKFRMNQKVITTLWDRINSLSEVEHFERLEKVAPKEFNGFVRNNPGFLDKLRQLILDDIEWYGDDDLEGLLERTSELKRKFSIRVNDVVDDLEHRIINMPPPGDSGIDFAPAEPSQTRVGPAHDEVAEITGMFDTLIRSSGSFSH